MIENILIIGYGMMGASLDKAILSKMGINCHIVVGEEVNVNELAIDNKIIYQTVYDLKYEDVKKQDLIILASPFQTFPEILKCIKPLLSNDTIVIDVASVKTYVAYLATEMGINLIPCHPMCGSEKSGYLNANENIFTNANVIITPLDKQEYSTIVQFWNMLGCKEIIMETYVHDSIMAEISHLPHVISYVYNNTIDSSNGKYGANSYKDIIRCSNSNTNLWANILIENKEYLLDTIDCFGKNLNILRNCLLDNDLQKLITFLDGND